MKLLELQGPAGRIEARLDLPHEARSVGHDGLVTAAAPGGPRAVAVLAHPHPQMGGTMHTKALYHAAKGLTRVGCAVLRFNFRGCGTSEGVWDEGRGEMDDCRAALDFAAERFPRTPLWCGGMSFGSWIGMTTGAADARVSTLIGIAPPIDRYDYEAVRTSPKAKFLIHGEFDEVTPVNAVKGFYARAAEPKELIVIDSADHLFDGKVSEVADAVEDLLGDWNE